MFMAKQNKKATQERNELDIILEQLKKSYSSESSENEEVSEEPSTTYETDSELHALLGKVFLDPYQEEPSPDTPKAQSPIKKPKNKKTDSSLKKSNKNNSTTPVSSDNDKTDVSNVAQDLIENELNTGNSENTIAIETDSLSQRDFAKVESHDSIIEDIPKFDTNDHIAENFTEDENYDPAADDTVEPETNDAITDSFAKDENYDPAADDIVEPEANDAITDSFVEDENYDCTVDVIVGSEANDDITESLAEDETDEFFEEDIIEDEPDNKANLIIEYPKSKDHKTQEPSIITSEDATDTFVVEDEEYDTEYYSSEDTPIPESSESIFDQENGSIDCTETNNTPQTALLILSPDEYIEDPLQEGLSVLNFVDIPSDSIDYIPEASIEKTTDHIDSLDINDISLLLKFGYEDEVKTKFGDENAHEAILEKDNYFIPEPHRIPFGYCGKEYSDKKQAKGIQEKYKSDKRNEITKLIAVSAIALLILFANIFFEFFSDRTSYPIVLSLEFLLVILIGLILYRKLYMGVVGILRFEAGVHSILVLVLTAYCAYDVLAMILYSVHHASISTADLMLFGFSVSIYSILTVFSDLITCIKESKTFELISSSDKLYVAEKQKSISIESTRAEITEKNQKRNYLNAKEHAYKIRQTATISGYFKKTAQTHSTSINLFYILGIVPILSLIVGCICALSSGSLLKGASSLMITALLCIPFTLVFDTALLEFFTASCLRKKNVVFIGNEASDEYAKTDTIIFTDTDAVEIRSYTEIQPSKNANIKKYISTAYEVFEALGGPFSKQMQQALIDPPHDPTVKHELIINEISDNGINIYFNSSMNILLGDRNYMRLHGINVKTDSNLSTATRGTECAVIYMAFDGSPKLGFIINSAVKPNFLDSVVKLEQNNIKVFVETYEPQINDLFFEQNKGNNTTLISVKKPGEYEDPHHRALCDSGIVSTADAVSVTGAIIHSRRINAQRAQLRRSHFALTIGGFLCACLLVILLSVSESNSVLIFLKSHISFFFDLFMFIGVIPSIIYFVKLIKSQKQHTDGANND